VFDGMLCVSFRRPSVQNKKKSKQVQKFVATVTSQVKNMGNQKVMWFADSCFVVGSRSCCGAIAISSACAYVYRVVDARGSTSGACNRAHSCKSVTRRV
jgi:hypothetical protein